MSDARNQLLHMLDEVSLALYGKRFEICLGKPQEIIARPGTKLHVDLKGMRKILKTVPRGKPIVIKLQEKGEGVKELMKEFTPTRWMESMIEHASKHGIEIETT